MARQPETIIADQAGVDGGEGPVTERTVRVTDAENSPLGKALAGQYELVAAGETAEALGATGGALGDFLSHVVIIPDTDEPGAVSIKDGDNAAIEIFAGGTLPSVAPFTVYLGLKSVDGEWAITTGADVSVLAVGSFT
jgi:hypothetical protein